MQTQSTTTHDKIQSPNFNEFAAFLHRGGSWAYLWDDDGKRTTWYLVGKPAPIPQNARRLLFGVHPVASIPERWDDGKRRAPESHRARICEIVAINCLYAEFDAKDFAGDKARILAHIDRLAVAPSVIVDSGGGYHCYWLLAAPFVFQNHADRERARRLQAAWVHYVGGDPAAKDLARVLRVPGTLNHKYTPPRPVVMVRADLARAYRLADLETLVQPAETQPARTRTTTSTPAGDGSKWLRDALAEARPGNRNATGAWLGQQLRDDRIPLERARDIMRDYARRVPAGDHEYTEREALASLASAYAREPREPARRQGTPTLRVLRTEPPIAAAERQPDGYEFTPAVKPRMVRRAPWALTREMFAKCPTGRCGVLTIGVNAGGEGYAGGIPPFSVCRDKNCECSKAYAAQRSIGHLTTWPEVWGASIPVESWEALRAALKVRHVQKARIPLPSGGLLALASQPFDGARRMTLDEVWEQWRNKPTWRKGEHTPRVSSDHKRRTAAAIVAEQSESAAAAIVPDNAIGGPAPLTNSERRDQLRRVLNQRADIPDERRAVARALKLYGLKLSGEQAELVRGMWLDRGFEVHGWRFRCTEEQGRAWARDVDGILTRIRRGDSEAVRNNVKGGEDSETLSPYSADTGELGANAGLFGDGEGPPERLKRAA